MPARTYLCLLLGAWLACALARLIFDLVGKLWIPVAFDLLQVVCCITGLFGGVQKRICLLVALVVSNLISTAENVLIFLWYIGVFGEISRPLLAAGLPYSFSFFLRFTPGCSSHFDLKRTIWVQDACIVPFYAIEAAQAVIHIVFAVVTTILAAVVIYERRKKAASRSPTVHSTSSQANYAHITPSKLGNAPSSINDGSSGYMNSTYEELGRSQVAAEPKARPAAEPRPSYERNSKRKRGKIRPNSMPAPDIKPCTSAPADCAQLVEDVYTKPVKSKVRIQAQDDIGEVEHEVIRGPTTVTSLVSFDPKSATLLRIREHLESEDDKELDYDSCVYERIRSRTATIEPQLGFYDSRLRNVSQESVPTMLAPMLTSPQESSSDSGMMSSGEWPIPHRAKSQLTNYEAQPKVSPVTSPGIKLLNGSPTQGLTSPGIRLIESTGAAKPPYKSAFRLQSKECRVIGHYHSPKEIPLTTKSMSVRNEFPVIKGTGLLV